eukprot:6459005-Amphidinium_carterae.1
MEGKSASGLHHHTPNTLQSGKRFSNSECVCVDSGMAGHSILPSDCSEQNSTHKFFQTYILDPAPLRK